jgi:DHA1 family multidrug resistance protein-like MFS transporter
LNSYVTAARGKLTPVRAMTLLSAGFNFGAVLGPVSGGWLADHLGLRTVYLVAACLFIFSTAVLLFIRSQPREVHDPDAPPPGLWTNARLFGFLAVIFVAMFAMYLPQPLTPKFLENVRGLSFGSIGLLGSLGSLGNALLNLLLGQLAARTGFLVAQLLVVAFSLLLWQGTGLPWYALAYFLLGGYRAARALILAQIRPLIHPGQMGLAYGIAETFNALSIVLAPLLAGVLYTREPVLVYPVAVGLILLGLLATTALLPRQPAAEAPVLSLPPDA